MRYSFGGDLCTRLFQGSIPAWPETAAIGVEWDNPVRGKNSGELDGKQYFECRVAGAGSFIKTTKKHDEPVDFDTAVRSKYLDDYQFDEITLSAHKTIESVGMDKIHARQSQLGQAHTLSVARCCISSFTNKGLAPELRSLESLDLSCNLFEDLQETFTFLRQFPLKRLNLSGNRFNEMELTAVLPHLEELNLGRTLVSPAYLQKIVAACPSLQRLGLCGNKLEHVPEFLDLQWVDLADNLISSVPATGRELVLAGNTVREIPRKLSYHMLNLMDQASHQLLEWRDLDNLVVADLWLSETKTRRIELIGRLPELRRLNGVEIGSAERTDCELYVISQIKHGALPPLSPNVHERLVAKHGLFAFGIAANTISARLLSVTVNGERLRIVRDAPVQRLLNMLSRRFGGRVDLGIDPLERVGTAIADGQSFSI